MNVKPIATPLPREHLNAVTPVMRPETDAGWRRHLNYWTGRALTADALEAEQVNRAARLAWRGRLVSPGVVSGLACELSLENPPAGAAPNKFAGYHLHLSPGYGIATSGEDVVLPQPLMLPLDQVPVAYLQEEDPLPPAPGVGPPGEPGKPWFLEYRLQGVAFREHQLEDKVIPWAGVLVLRPAETPLMAEHDPNDPCEYDPSFDAFSDPRRADTSRLVICALPKAWQDLPDLKNLVGGTGWRNRLAYALFADEAERAAGQDLGLVAVPGLGKHWRATDAEFSPSPWELLGVPLALISIEKDAAGASTVFLDRAALVRAGGVPRPRPRPAAALGLTGKSAPPPGTPRLWRARVDQFAAQIEPLDLEKPEALAAHFAYLPPAGLLPRSALSFITTDIANKLQQGDRAATSRFFPAGFSVEAVPIPTEQLDSAFAASAPLAPFHPAARQPDLVRVLVPLPQRVFDPRLLVIEEEDPFFATEANRLLLLRQAWRQRRDFVRRQQDELLKVISGVTINRPADGRDAEQVEAEPTEKPPPGPVLIPPPATLGPWRIEVTLDKAARATQETKFYVALHLDEETPPSRVEITWHAADGLELAPALDTAPPGVAVIENPADPTVARPLGRRYEALLPALGSEPRDVMNVTLILYDGRAALSEIGFLAPAALGEPVPQPWWVAGQQKVASPQGTWVQIGGQHGLAPFEDAYEPALPNGKVFKQELKDVLKTVEATLRKNKLLKDGEKYSTFENAGLEGVVAELQQETNRADDVVDLSFLRAQVNTHRIRRILLGESKADQLLTSASIGSIVAAKAGLVAENAITRLYSDAISKPQAEVEKLAAPGAHAAQPPPFATNIVNAIGAAANTVTSVGLAAAGGVVGAVRDQIMGAQTAIGQTFPLRTLTIAERFQPEATQAAFNHAHEHFSDLLSGLGQLNLDFDAKESIPGVTDANKKPVLFLDFIRGNIAFDKFKFPPAIGDTKDTAGNLAAGLFAADQIALILRRLEYFIAQKKILRARAQALLDAARAVSKAAAARLLVLEGQLAEARHDVSVARALWQEERDRVAAINQRRDDLIRDEVRFLAFVRPREIDLARRDTPSLPLDPFDAPAPVPACLQQHDEPPEPLCAYVQLFRHAPIGWFPELHAPLRWIDTREAMATLVQAAQQSATRFVSTASLVRYNFVAPALTATYQSAFSLVEARRRLAAGLQVIAPPLRTWDDHRRDAEEHGTVGDLIDGSHGKPAVARAAAAMLEQIESVATCLHAEFAAVAPATRLRWVERYSQFDQPSPLRQLAVLPGYAALARDARRRFQAFVDWLFQRVNETDAGAFALINDLVRLCLLLASHAPVNQIITGHLPRPTPVRPGILIPLRPINPPQVRVGMEFHVWHDAVLVARGIVEDLREGEVSARVIHTQRETLDASMRVQFVPPALSFAKNLMGPAH